MPQYHEAEIRVWSQEDRRHVSKPFEFKGTKGQTAEEALQTIGTILSNAPTAGTGEVRMVDTDR